MTNAETIIEPRTIIHPEDPLLVNEVKLNIKWVGKIRLIFGSVISISPIVLFLGQSRRTKCPQLGLLLQQTSRTLLQRLGWLYNPYN